MRSPHDETYETIMGSDLERDGMYLELRNRSRPQELILSAFYSDADGSFVFERQRDDVPPEVELWFRQEARRRLPPSANA